MSIKPAKPLALILVAGALLPSASLAQNFINGGFETPVAAYAHPADWTPDFTYMPGAWSLEADTHFPDVPIAEGLGATWNGTPPGPSPQGGAFATIYVGSADGIDLSVALSQTVSGFAVGEIYTLSYYYAATTIIGTVPADPPVTPFVALNGGGYLSGELAATATVEDVWLQHTATFLANSDTITFTAYGAVPPTIPGVADDALLGFDGFNITHTPVPEPSAALLGLTASAGLLLRRRRAA